MIIMPSSPRFITPDLSAKISPIVGNSKIVPERIAEANSNVTIESDCVVLSSSGRSCSS